MKKLLAIVIFLCTAYLMQYSTPGILKLRPVVQSKFTKRKFLALGDSYTIGQSVKTNERFPEQTVSMLRNKGIQVDDPLYIARTGWTTDDLALAISDQQPSNGYDIVTLLIGVNDQFQKHDTSGYRSKFQGLLKTAIQLAAGNNKHVFVLSIPDYAVTPFGMNYDTALITRQINWFNEINRSVSLQNQCNYIDITPSSRNALHDPSLIADDGLHPSGKEYQKWAGMLFETCYGMIK